MEKRESVWEVLKEKMIENRTNYVIWTVVYFIVASVLEWTIVLMMGPGFLELGSPMLRVLIMYFNIVLIYLAVIFFKEVSKRGAELKNEDQN